MVFKACDNRCNINLNVYSKNHGVLWIRRDFKDHLFPAPNLFSNQVVWLTQEWWFYMKTPLQDQVFQSGLETEIVIGLTLLNRLPIWVVGSGRFQVGILKELHFQSSTEKPGKLFRQQAKVPRMVTELFRLGMVFKIMESPSGMKHTCWDTDGCCPCLFFVVTVWLWSWNRAINWILLINLWFNSS